MSDRGESNKVAGNDGQPGLFWGRAACGLGVVLAAAGIAAAFSGTGASVVPGAVGVGLGILGYFLGSNRFGTITIILCTAALFFGLAASQGLIPGIEASDRNMPDDSPVAD